MKEERSNKTFALPRGIRPENTPSFDVKARPSGIRVRFVPLNDVPSRLSLLLFETAHVLSNTFLFYFQTWCSSIHRVISLERVHLLSY